MASNVTSVATKSMPDIRTKQKNSECYKCKMKGHWARVCRGKRLAGMASLDKNFPSLACQVGPDITNVSCKINKFPLKAMIDLGSCSTFISNNAAKKKKKMKLFHRDQKVFLRLIQLVRQK